jgi:hypothetical protein
MWPVNGAGDEQSSGSDSEDGDGVTPAVGFDPQHPGGMVNDGAPDFFISEELDDRGDKEDANDGGNKQHDANNEDDNGDKEWEDDDENDDGDEEADDDDDDAADEYGDVRIKSPLLVIPPYAASPASTLQVWSPVF